jgi:hypothetical protein
MHRLDKHRTTGPDQIAKNTLEITTFVAFIASQLSAWILIGIGSLSPAAMPFAASGQCTP